jgi:N-acylneuraminate cytidylyltransferase
MKIIIPARGGSKRIPGKNIISLNGLPLITHVITTSLKITNNVYVSTDCEKIATIAKQYGAKIINRPCSLATDASTTNSVIEHFLHQVADVEYFACVQPTSPLLDVGSLSKGIDKIRKQKFNSIISVCENTNFFWSKSGIPINFIIGQRPRTQNMERWYCENGAFYITSKDDFLKTKKLINGKIGFIQMPKIASFEIDDLEDLQIVKKLMN